MLGQVKRVAIFVIGWLLIGGGLIGLVLPILPGVLLLVNGAFLLRSEWPWPYEVLAVLRDRFRQAQRSIDSTPSTGEPHKSLDSRAVPRNFGG